MTQSQALVPIEETPAQSETPQAATGPWARVFLGDVPIWFDAGTIQRQIEAKGAEMSQALASVPGAALSPKMRTLRGLLPGLIRTLMDLTGWAIDMGWLDLPRPRPPKKADALAYFVQWATRCMLDVITETDWDATYAETPDGGCAITALAPRPIVAGETADGAGDAQGPGSHHAEGERGSRPDV